MKREEIIMGMPVRVIINDRNVKCDDFQTLFSYLKFMDNTFSTYKKNSEIGKINSGELSEKNCSLEVRKILSLCDQTRIESKGYFDIHFNGKIDPSGIVKGYAISNAAEILRKKGYRNFSVEIAGDVQVCGNNGKNRKWKIGIQNPFNINEIVKVVYLSERGIATSGTYKRGKHIYNPIRRKSADDIASMTVIAPNVFDADRFATAAFAMGEKGINFIEELTNCEGYMITKDKKAYLTKGFEMYLS